jgi:TPR repeat protein
MRRVSLRIAACLVAAATAKAAASDLEDGRLSPAPVSPVQPAATPAESTCPDGCEGESPDELFARAAQYASGTSGPPDFARAAPLLRGACDGGHARACSNLGVLYHEGKGVAQDEAEATLLFERACDAAYAPACFNLGLSVETVDLDNARALSLFQKACALRYAPACSKLQRSSRDSQAAEAQPAPSEPMRSSCRLFAPDPWPDDCWTPRPGIVSGGFFGIDVGYLVLDEAAAQRISAGNGVAVNGRLGIAMWDQLLVTLSFGGLHPADQAPISELVVTCTEANGVRLECGDPHELDSVLKGGYASYELGYQYRFRPLKRWSIAPAALVGYMTMFNGLRREVECEGCPGGKPLPISLDGAFLTGLLRMTFGQAGLWSVMTRTQWFLTGDTRHITSFGVEFLAP